jgi:hypothetical protein
MTKSRIRAEPDKYKFSKQVHDICRPQINRVPLACLIENRVYFTFEQGFRRCNKRNKRK